MSFNFMLLYITTVFIATIIPGPSMLLALTHGMQFGARRTIASALGNLSVTLLQAFISVAGLGAVLIASETAFDIIKLAGAAYLVYLGIGILLTSKTTLTAEKADQTAQEMTLGKMYLQAALVTAGNPKAIVFFTAVFPQFIDPGGTYLPQFIAMMVSGTVIAFGCFMLYAISGQQIVSLFCRDSIGKRINRIIGGTFIGAGIALAAGNR